MLVMLEKIIRKTIYIFLHNKLNLSVKSQTFKIMKENLLNIVTFTQLKKKCIYRRSFSYFSHLT